MKKIKYLFVLLILSVFVLTTSTAQFASIDPISIGPPDEPIGPPTIATLKRIGTTNPHEPSVECIECGLDCFVLSCRPK
jgi:hypothetical protein